MTAELNKHFQQLVDSGRPVGEVIGVNNFLIQVRGLQPINSHALVMFEDGSQGLVHLILEDRITILRLNRSRLRIGSLVVLQQEELLTKVGRDFVGRVVSVTGEPIDGKGAIAADANWPVFNQAPPIYQRELLSTQLETGVTIIDTLFPIVRGQRMSLLGDSKSGKSTLATQIAVNQRNTDQIVVYVLIAKKRSDIDLLLSRLSEAKSMDKCIVVVSTIFESLVNSYLAPYVGCALAEYLWQTLNQDVVIIYDDLSTHAHAYREIALLSGVSPGRDSYPGDIFHAHSSLLERAGKLAGNHNSLTAVPLALTEGGDISSYLPTNVMSITDGQWILDMNVFRTGLRPAINIGLSVTRVGGLGQNDRQKSQNTQIFKILTEYNRAQEFAHFSTDATGSAKYTSLKGQQLYQLFTQAPTETYGLLVQQLMIDAILADKNGVTFDIGNLKAGAAEAAKNIKNPSDYISALNQLSQHLLLEGA